MPSDIWSFPGQEDPNNTGVQTVAAGAYWEGAFTDVAGFGCIDLAVVSSVTPTPSQIEIDWSEDGITTAKTWLFNGTLSGQSGQFTLPAYLSFYKIRVQNGAAVPADITPTAVIRPIRPPQLLHGAGWTNPADIAVPLGLGYRGGTPSNSDFGSIVFGQVSSDPLIVPAAADSTYTWPTLDTRGARYVHQRAGVIEGRTVKTAFVDSAAGGNITVVAAVAAKSIWLLSYQLSMGGTATTLFFKDGAAGSQISMSHRMPINGSFIAPAGPGVVYAKGTAATALVINASAANPISVQVEYIEV